MNDAIQTSVISRTSADSAMIRPLTSLRMIAAFLVFIEHFIGIPYGSLGANFWEAIAIEGHIGVTIFFVLSGFLLTLRYYDRAQDGKLSLYDYFTKRAARIYPLYYVLLIFLLALGYQPLNSLATMANLTLTTGFFQTLTVLIPTVWSLTVEECFYLLLPLFFFTTKRFRVSNASAPRRELTGLLALICGWTIALVLIGLAVMRISSALGLADNYGVMYGLPYVIYMTIFFRFSQFAVGIFFARFYQRILLPWWSSDHHTAKQVVYIALFISVVGIALCTYLMNLGGGVYSQGWIYNYLVALFTGILILGLTYQDTVVARLLSHPLPVYLGRVSYALYLVQITPIARNTIVFLGASTLLSKYIVLTGISIVLYEFIEKPGSVIVNRLTYRLKQQLQAGAS